MLVSEAPKREKGERAREREGERELRSIFHEITMEIKTIKTSRTISIKKSVQQKKLKIK